MVEMFVFFLLAAYSAVSDTSRIQHDLPLCLAFIRSSTFLIASAFSQDKFHYVMEAHKTSRQLQGICSRGWVGGWGNGGWGGRGLGVGGVGGGGRWGGGGVPLAAHCGRAGSAAAKWWRIY